MELEKPKKLSERQHGVVGVDEELEEQEAQGVGEELEEEVVEAVEQLLPEAADMMAMVMMTMTMMMMMMTEIRREVAQEEEPGARRPREGRGLRPLEDEGQQLELGRLLIRGRDRQLSVSPLLLPIPKVH